MCFPLIPPRSLGRAPSLFSSLRSPKRMCSPSGFAGAQPRRRPLMFLRCHCSIMGSSARSRSSTCLRLGFPKSRNQLFLHRDSWPRANCLARVLEQIQCGMASASAGLRPASAVPGSEQLIPLEPDSVGSSDPYTRQTCALCTLLNVVQRLLLHPS